MTTAALLIMTLATVLYIASPFIAGFASQPSNQGSEHRNLTLRKEKLLSAFRDLELDFQTQKMTERDFRTQKAALLAELDGVYKALDACQHRP